MNVISIVPILSKKRQDKEMRKLDAQASYVCIEKCLNYLNMNDLPEIKDLKENMKEAMKKLNEIGK